MSKGKESASTRKLFWTYLFNIHLFLHKRDFYADILNEIVDGRYFDSEQAAFKEIDSHSLYNKFPKRKNYAYIICEIEADKLDPPATEKQRYSENILNARNIPYRQLIEKDKSVIRVCQIKVDIKFCKEMQLESEFIIAQNNELSVLEIKYKSKLLERAKSLLELCPQDMEIIKIIQDLCFTLRILINSFFGLLKNERAKKFEQFQNKVTVFLEYKLSILSQYKDVDELKWQIQEFIDINFMGIRQDVECFRQPVNIHSQELLTIKCKCY